MPTSSPIVWQIARPPQFSARPDMQDLDDFLRNLERRLREQGHHVVTFPFASVPWTRRGITLNFHTTGYAPNTYHYKESFLKNWVQIDWLGHTGWHSNNLAPVQEKDGPLFKAREATLDARIEAYVTSRQSKYAQHDDGNFSIQQDFVFFPLQKGQDDTTSFARFDLAEVIEKLGKICAARGWKLVLKRHPFCHSKRIDSVLEKIKGDENILFTQGHVADFIARAKAVVTVNSSVGFEALLRGRRIITLGQAEYTPSSITVRNLDELDTALSEAAKPADVADGRRQIRQFIMQSLFEKNNPQDIDCFIEAAMQKYRNSFGTVEQSVQPLVQHIDFSETGNCQPYLLHGFSFGEEWGTWSNDECASFFFIPGVLPTGMAGGGIIKVRGYLKDIWPRITFDIYVNGACVRRGATVAAGQKTVLFGFPMQLCDGINTVSLRVRQPVRPVDLGVDFDVRRLGIGVMAFTHASEWQIVLLNLRQMYIPFLRSTLKKYLLKLLKKPDRQNI